eukprot:2750782-Amphidinium_carterae.1
MQHSAQYFRPLLAGVVDSDWLQCIGQQMWLRRFSLSGLRLEGTLPQSLGRLSSTMDWGIGSDQLVVLVLGYSCRQNQSDHTPKHNK